MEGENAKAGRYSHHSRQSQHRASYESHMRRPRLVTDNQCLLSNVHADPGASGDFRNSASQYLNATAAEERHGHTESRKPPQIPMRLDTDAAQQRPERTSLQPTAERSDPLYPESSTGPSTGPSTPNYDRVLSLIETLRSKVESFVTGSFDLPSEVDRSHARTRIYRPVIDLVQDKEANRNPKACMCPLEPSQSLALGLTLRSNRHGGCKENKTRPRRPSQTL
jgi:hypothetical protein